MAMALLTFAIAGSTPKFKDVLETPALKSALAAKSLLNGIAVAGKRLVSVGQRGHILYSDDGGKNWTQVQVPASSDLVAVYFPTPEKGWAVGHDGVVLHSADSGLTWVKQFDGYAAARIALSYYTAHPPAGRPGGTAAVSGLQETIQRFVQEGADKHFLDVWFDNETDGFIVGSFNTIFHTTDGGRNWQPWFERTENPGLAHLYAVRRIGQDIFISGEQGLVLKLDPGAGMFRRVKVPYPGTFFGVTGRTGALLVFGMRGQVFRSANGGQSWQKVETGVSVGLTGSTVTKDGRLVLVSQGGDVLVSKDDGLSFQTAKVEKALPAAAVAAFGEDTLVLAGFGGLAIRSIK
ncbi:MAG: glycosyl hydrolase [Deltaproteobacteria bacterium]|nr:glycosyl hydrolase [Deltaproteobacteria bacterium]